MGISIIGAGGTIADVGEKASAPQHVVQKPISASVGHYRTAISLTMATTQAANSRLFEIRNTGTNLLILTRCYVEVVPSGTVTTAYVGEIGLWRCTSFSAVDTTNTVTPTGSIKRTTGMTAYPGNANVRHVTVAGAAAGMTGGTLTKDGNMLGSCIGPVLTGPTAGNKFFRELVEDTNGTHPLVCAQNEGWIIENVRVGSGTSNVVTVMLDVSWAEATAF
jgi:hypothetical protein